MSEYNMNKPVCCVYVIVPRAKGVDATVTFGAADQQRALSPTVPWSSVSFWLSGCFRLVGYCYICVWPTLQLVPYFKQFTFDICGAQADLFAVVSCLLQSFFNNSLCNFGFLEVFLRHSLAWFHQKEFVGRDHKLDPYCKIATRKINTVPNQCEKLSISHSISPLCASVQKRSLCLSHYISDTVLYDQ